MNIEEKVQSILSGAAGVIALCPAAKISVIEQAQGITPPYVRHFPVDGEPTLDHNSGVVNLKYWLYQVSCFETNYAKAKALALAVNTALGSYRQGGIVSMQHGAPRPMPYEFDVQVQQFVLEFDIWDSL